MHLELKNGDSGVVCQMRLELKNGDSGMRAGGSRDQDRRTTKWAEPSGFFCYQILESFYPVTIKTQHEGLPSPESSSPSCLRWTKTVRLNG